MQRFLPTRWLGRLTLGLGAAMLGLAALAAGPTLDQVYQAAQAGRLAQAQQMMDEVLRSHPQSGKAHYVRAELFAREGRGADARAELATAERFAPGLPFADPQAVQALRSRIGTLSGGGAMARAGGTAPAGSGMADGLGGTSGDRAPVAGAGPTLPRAGGGASGFAWGPWVLGGALALGVLAFFRRTRRREPPGFAAMGNACGDAGPGGPFATAPAYGGPSAMASSAGGAVVAQPSYGSGAGPAPSYGGPAGAPYGPAGQGMPGNAPVGGGQAGGLGGGLLGGLATGAAVGAGVVAGQALMHRMLDGSSSHGAGLGGDVGAAGLGAAAGQGSIFRDISGPQALPGDAPYDMGGQDFGIADSGSWDDAGGGGGGDDWT